MLMENSLSKEFEKNGFILAKNIFSKKEALNIKASIKNGLMKDFEDEKTGVNVFFHENVPQWLTKTMCDQRIISILKDILGNNIEFLSVKVVKKSGKISFGTPWHQDKPYWEGSTKISIWIALDDANKENGCLQVIPGSHGKFVKHLINNNEIGFGSRLEPSKKELEGVIDVIMKSGDVLFFHDQLFHSSHPNTSGLDRWSLIPTYRNADIFDSSTTWDKSIAKV